MKPIETEVEAREVYRQLSDLAQNNELEFPFADLLQIAGVMGLTKQDVQTMQSGSRAIAKGKSVGGRNKTYSLKDIHEIYVAKRLKIPLPQAEWKEVLPKVLVSKNFGSEKNTLFTEALGHTLLTFLAKQFLPEVPET